jgi:hypothetical protein
VFFWKLSWIIVWNKIESACGSRWNTQIDKLDKLPKLFSWTYWTHLWNNQKKLFISHTNNEKYTKSDLLRKNEFAILIDSVEETVFLSRIDNFIQNWNYSQTQLNSAALQIKGQIICTNIIPNIIPINQVTKDQSFLPRFQEVALLRLKPMSY